MFPRIFQCLAVACLGFVVGCGQSQPVDNSAAKSPSNRSPAEDADDPHNIPLTDAEIEQLREDTGSWTAAVEHIQKYRDTIKTEAMGDTPAKAHRSLDLLDYVLQWMPEIAQNNNVPKNNWQTIGESSQKLRDLFNQVHANIDAGQAPDYESVDADIEAAVEALAAIKPGGSLKANAPE